MRYYLSSYKLGNQTDKLKAFAKKSSEKFGYIPNARDFTRADPQKRKASLASDMQELQGIGLEAEILDLKDYFGREDELRQTINDLGGIYIGGGNVFILRQAMKLSGLDTIITKKQTKNDFVYSGYSAACCVLSPTLKAYTIVDAPSEMPYPELKEPIWDGLGILDFVFQPHYDSPRHPETEMVDKEIQFCIDNKILFKAYHDGEVLIIE